jgi:excisionase family DNA binding protein
VRLYTVKETADRLNVSISFVYGLIASGRLKHYVLGAGRGGKRVSDAQLDEYLKSVERGGGKATTARYADTAKPMVIKLKHLDLSRG